MTTNNKETEDTTIDIFEMHAELCKVFSDPKRLRIMWCLQKGEQSVGDLAQELDLTLSNASHHLRLMYDRGAVLYRREGKTVIYRIANEKFSKGCLQIRAGLLEQLKRKNNISLP